MKIIAIAFLFCFTVGCATTKKTTSNPISIIAPAEGNAAIYIFRPDLDQVRKADVPSLFIDGALVAQLPHASYTRVEIPVGKHSLKLSSKKPESTIWNAETAFELSPRQVYFIAIWNSNQPRKMVANVPIVLPGLLTLIPIYGPGSSSKSGTAFEAVDRVTGEFSLVNLRYIPTN